MTPSGDVAAGAGDDTDGTSGEAGGQAPAAGLPARYRLWLAGTTFSLVGTHTLGFAMVWAAASHSGLLAGLVLTMITLPRVSLLLVGGAVTDRTGAWRVMIAGDAVMTVAALALAAGVGVAGEAPWLLLATGLVIGVVDAFYLPASGSMPRRLVPGRALARAMSARQLAGQGAALAGAPLGGALVAWAGLAPAALADAATFAVMLAILLGLRPRAQRGRGSGPPPEPVAGPSRGAGHARAGNAPDPGEAPAGAAAGVSESLWRSCVDGLGVAAGDRLLRPALLLVVAAAGFLIPVPGMLLPVLARQRAWPAGATGLVVGALALGTAAAAALTVLRGAYPRPGVVAVSGLWTAALGLTGLTLAGYPAWAAAAGAVAGLGTGLFAAHVAPLVLGHAPVTHLARVQAVVVLAQSLPLLATNGLLGALADEVGAAPVLAGCAAVLSAGGLAAPGSPALRRAALPG